MLQPNDQAQETNAPRVDTLLPSGSNSDVVHAADWDRRLDGLLPALPRWAQAAIVWLRVPSRRWFRLGAGLCLVAGGFLAILPVFGLWMLPLGLALISEDYPPLKLLLERTARWGERVWQRMRRR